MGRLLGRLLFLRIRGYGSDSIDAPSTLIDYQLTMTTAMKNVFALLLFVVLSMGGCTWEGLEESPFDATKLITPELMQSHVFALADDSMEGRNTPSPGLDRAAHYIADQFKADGLPPIGGTYLHDVGLGIVSLGPENHLRVTKEGQPVEYRIKRQFTPFDMTANKGVEGPIVFTGYGISAPEFGYDDFAGIDVKGAIVLVLRHEPGEEDSSSVFDGVNLTDHSNVSQKVEKAIEHGAAGVMVVTDPLNHSLFTPRGFPWPSLSRIIPKDALPVSLTGDEASKVPVVHVGEEVIEQLFGSIDSLRNLQKSIDAALTPHSFRITGAIASIRTSTSVKPVPADNVVAYIPGNDPELKDQVVIIGAHYDHVGTSKSATTDGDTVFNGADDNASGTTALLGVAHAFSTINRRPKRTVVFVAFAGEEKGLLGSRAYANAPLFPIENTVAMLNMDMVGRNSIDSLTIVGASSSPELLEITNEENESIGFHFIYDNTIIGRSDHASFMKKKIPALAYFSGFHADYHKVTDEPELINTEKLARVARLVFRTAWRIANEDRTYQFIESPSSSN